jgi:hypothetical protein
VNEDTQDKQSVFERHAQTIIALGVLGLVVWAGTTLLTIRDDVTTLKIQVNVLQTQLNNAGDDRFRGADWRREREIIESRFNRIEALLEKHTEDYNRRNAIEPAHRNGR